MDFCACLSHNALKHDAGGKKGKLLCCKCTFDWIKGNLAEIQPKNHQSVQKTHFLQKVLGVNCLRAEFIVSVIRLTVFSADPVISFLKGAWHLSLLRIYSLAFKYTDMSLASFFEKNVLDCNKLINFTLIIEHKRNPCQ